VPAELTSRMTLDAAFAANLPYFADREALVYGNSRITYREMGEKIAALAGNLCALGIQPGERVAAIMPNSPELLYCFYAVPQAGAVLVPINPNFKLRELRHILSESEAVAVILVPQVWGNNLLDIVEELRPELPRLRHVIIKGDAKGQPADVLPLSDLLVANPDHPAPAPGSLRKPEDLYGLMYTSGTTGVPKAVMHSHYSVLASMLGARNSAMKGTPEAMQRFAARYGARFGRYYGKPWTNLGPSPYHALAGYGLALSCIMDGNRLLVVERFLPTLFMELIQREQVNVLVGPPSIYTVLVDMKDADKYDTSSLLYAVIATAPCPPELARRVRDMFGCPVMIPFGATETGSGALTTQLSDPDDIAFNTVGTVMPGVEIRIVNDEHQEVAKGEVGELAIKREGNMLGYFNAPEATAAVLDAEGWYYTGDLATIDDQGNVKIVGRKKDLILRGGQNVYPVEIENFLMTMPQVQLAAVIGVPTRVGGEKVWAFLLLNPGTTLTAKDVLAYCRANIAGYKVPDEVRIVENLPMTPTGKIQKFMLRELAVSQKS
jgi:fatty-acyl-CoA synthase